MRDGPLGQAMQAVLRRSRAAVAFVAALGLWGCVVEGGVSAGAGVGIAVAGPPPEPVGEPHPPPPPGQVVWIAGYWHWTGMRYTWIPGHWERAPAGSAWHPPRYWARDGTYYYEPGGWGREGR
jgi:WXXGXW repeat (2 copies)